MTPARLFDEIERTDPTPASWSEQSFPFLNRVDTAYWARIRGELDDWFADYASCASPEKAADLRARFRSDDPKQHLPAWWELYVFRFLRRRYPEHTIAVERERLEQTTSPDFCVLDERDEAFLYVEAVAPFVGISEPKHPGVPLFLDTINAVESRDYCVMLGALDTGPDLLRKTEIVQPIKEWLAGLDYGEVVTALREGRRHSSLFDVGGWRVEMHAWPRTVESPGPRGLIAAGPIFSGFVDDVEAVRKALRRKAWHYGALDCPFVIAVMLPSAFTSIEAILEALYGSDVYRSAAEHPEGGQLERGTDGFWSARTSHVSALIFGTIFPWTVATTWPQLWMHPASLHPLGDYLGLPRAVITGPFTVEWIEPSAPTPALFFDLAADWPGPDEPFPHASR